MNFINQFVSSSDVLFVGEFIKNENSTNLLKFKWNIDSTTKKNKSGRVYFFIEVDSENKKDILKIGKSSDKNGLPGTIGFYVNTLSGTPSITRYSVHNLIYRKLQENKKVLVYCKFSNSIKTKIKGIFEEHESEIPLDMTYVEELCLTEYHKNYLKFPEWNFQESNTQIPFDLLESYSMFIENKKNKKNK